MAVYENPAGLPESWNSFIPAQSPWMKRENLAALSAAEIPGLELQFAVVYNGNIPVAGFCFQTLHAGPEHLHVEAPQEFLPRMLWNIGFRNHLTVLILGSLHHNGPGYWKSPVMDTEVFNYALNSVLRLAAKDTRPDITLLKDTDSLPRSWRRSVSCNSNFAPAPEDIQMQLNLRPEWQTISDYAAELSKKYAARFTKTRKAAEGVIVKSLGAEEIQEREAELDSLYNNILQAAAVKLTRINAKYLYTLKKVLGDDFLVEGWFIGNQLAGFSATFLRESCNDIFVVGYDAGANAEYKLYHNMLFRGLEQAITMRKARLMLGRTALEAKAILGAEAVESRHLLRVKSRFLRIGIRRAMEAELSGQGEGWKKRNPFSKSKTLETA